MPKKRRVYLIVGTWSHESSDVASVLDHYPTEEEIAPHRLNYGSVTVETWDVNSTESVDVVRV
jgi:hypothetical protein